MTEHLAELLSAALDGELSHDETRQLNEHLPTCGECTQELEDLHAARSALRGLATLEAPDFGAAGLPAEVIPFRKTRRTVAAVAAAFIAFVGVATYQSSRPTVVSFQDVSQVQMQLDQDAPTLIPNIPAGSE